MATLQPQTPSTTTETLLQFAYKFPDAARWLWDANLKVQTYLAKMSPEVRAKVISMVTWWFSLMYSMLGIFIQVYNYVMALPGIPVEEWKQPSDSVLKAVAGLILFMAPIQGDFSSLLNDERFLTSPSSGQDRFMFVANTNLLAFESLSLVSAIYLKTGIWPRRYTDIYHFKIPVWKHLIEYFGAIPTSNPSNPDTLAKVMAKGHAILIHPAGRAATLTVSETSTPPPTIPESRRDLLELSLSNNYTFIPLATTGPTEMIRVLLHVRVDPILYLLGDRGEGTQDWDKFTSIPVVIPRSYERMYTVAGSTIVVTQESAVAVAEARDRIEAGIRECLRRARECQKVDETRYLLKPLMEALEGKLPKSAAMESTETATGSTSASSSTTINGSAPKTVGIEDMLQFAASLTSTTKEDDTKKGR